mmetsp:Transcript_28006/g.47467  ORF Transcript_28006/g.47467 Transcript_28006/m.47467 type:complete len:100 (+) Transcript_28006:350-649(+)
MVFFVRIIIFIRCPWSQIKNEEHSPSYSNPSKKRNRSELNTLFSGSPYPWWFPMGQKRQRRVRCSQKHSIRIGHHCDVICSQGGGGTHRYDQGIESGRL